jgi:hypothetical protein
LVRAPIHSKGKAGITQISSAPVTQQYYPEPAEESQRYR